MPSGLTKEAAQNIRQAIVNAPSRVDFIDRAILIKSPTMAVRIIKYSQDGVLVSFGQPRDAFTVPSPYNIPLLGRLPQTTPR